MTPLFRGKRAKTLAALLGIRRNLVEAGLGECSAAALRKALESPRGKHAVRQLVRLVKAEHVGVDMMDIIICGAVAPYNVVAGREARLPHADEPAGSAVLSHALRRAAEHHRVVNERRAGCARAEPGTSGHDQPVWRWIEPIQPNPRAS